MHRIRHSLTTRGSAFLTSGVVLLLSGLLLGLSDLSRIGVLLLAVIALAAMLVVRHGLAFEVSRSAQPTRISVDEQAVVVLRVTNRERRRSPLALAEEQLDYALGDRPRFLVPALGAGQTCELRYVVRPHLRGLHQLGPLQVLVRDPFGVTSRPASIRGSGSLLVLPRIHPLRSGRRLSRALGSEGGVPNRVALHGEDDQIVREYRDGDDLRRIHWPATARTGELMVRQEDRPAKRRAVILLDSRRDAHVGTGRSSSFEWGVTMAASVGAHLAELNHEVSLLSADPSSDTGTRLDSDIDTMLLTLAQIQPVAQDTLGALLHSAHDAMSGAGLIVALVGGMDDVAARALSSLRGHGATGIALVLVPPGRATDRGSRAREQLCLGTLATLEAAGWVGLAVRGGGAPEEVWSTLTGSATVEVAR